MSPCSSLRLHQALGGTDMGMTFRELSFSTLGTAQYGDTEESYIEAREAHNLGRCRRSSCSSIEL